MLVCVACSAKHARDSRWAAAKYLQQILDIEWLQISCAHTCSCDDSSLSAEVTGPLSQVLYATGMPNGSQKVRLAHNSVSTNMITTELMLKMTPATKTPK
jgi:hypothetical protein